MGKTETFIEQLSFADEKCMNSLKHSLNHAGHADLDVAWNIHWTIEPLRDNKVVLSGLLTDSQRYFDFHHAANDTFDAINKRELELGAAAMASLVYLVDQYGF